MLKVRCKYKTFTERVVCVLVTAGKIVSGRPDALPTLDKETMCEDQERYLLVT